MEERLESRNCEFNRWVLDGPTVKITKAKIKPIFHDTTDG